MSHACAAMLRLVLPCILLVAVCSQPFASARAAPVPPLTSPVVDATGTLAADEIERLERQALALQRRSGAQLQVLMLSSTAPQSIEDYAQRVFDVWKLGRQGVDDGLLLIVAKDDRKVRIHTGTGLESKITDATAARLIQEYLVPKFRRGDYAGGLDDATVVIASLMNGQPLPAPMAAQESEAGVGSRTIALVLGIVLGILVRLACEWFAVRVQVRIAFTILFAAVTTLLAGGGWAFALAAGIVGLFVAMIGGGSGALAAVGGRGASWRADELTWDPNAPDAVARRKRREREAADSDDDGWFGGGRPGGGFGGGFGGGGWSGGGGSSRGGGASGGW